jgi:L-ascorbate metabolism protein UlaG (beta-lactamase superfamily)
MQISWIGHSSFKIRSKDALIVTDPFENSIGVNMPKTSADIVLVSHEHFDHNNLKAIKGETFVINTPGEYSVKNVSILGIPSWHDEQKGAERGQNTIFKFTTENISLCHLGDLGTKLTAEQIDALGEIDVLFIPIGGKYTLDFQKADEVIAQIEPRLVIPMHFKTKNITLDIDDEKQFLKEEGLNSASSQDILKITSKNLPSDETQIVFLKPQAK